MSTLNYVRFQTGKDAGQACHICGKADSRNVFLLEDEWGNIDDVMLCGTCKESKYRDYVLGNHKIGGCLYYEIPSGWEKNPYCLCEVHEEVPTHFFAHLGGDFVDCVATWFFSARGQDWPLQAKKGKMLLYLYNSGVLDIIDVTNRQDVWQAVLTICNEHRMYRMDHQDFMVAIELLK